MGPAFWGFVVGGGRVGGGLRGDVVVGCRGVLGVQVVEVFEIFKVADSFGEW